MSFIVLVSSILSMVEVFLLSILASLAMEQANFDSEALSSMFTLSWQARCRGIMMFLAGSRFLGSTWWVLLSSFISLPQSQQVVSCIDMFMFSSWPQLPRGNVPTRHTMKGSMSIP